MSWQRVGWFQSLLVALALVLNGGVVGYLVGRIEGEPPPESNSLLAPGWETSTTFVLEVGSPSDTSVRINRSYDKNGFETCKVVFSQAARMTEMKRRISAMLVEEASR